MPTQLRCAACGAWFYTATGEVFLDADQSCAQCGEPLAIIKDRNKVVKPNLPVRLLLYPEATATDHSTSHGPYTSRIESVSEESLELSVPLRENEPIWMRPGTRLRVQFVRREPAVQGRYRFRTEVIDCRWEPNPVLIAESPEEIVKIQERDSLRFAVQTPVKYRIPGETAAQPANFRTGYTVNLSNSGLLLAVDCRDLGEAEEGIRLEMLLTVGDSEVDIQGRVVRVLDSVKKGNGKGGLGIEFSDLSREDGEQVKRFIGEYVEDHGQEVCRGV